MNNGEIKKTVKEFRKKYDIIIPSYSKLVEIFNLEGFTVLEFNPFFNDENIDALVNSLQLQNLIKKSRGFTYADGNHRLVFISEKLTSEEKRIVLAHEMGHYKCGHLNKITVVGQDVLEEYESNEFVHYLLEEPITQRIQRTVLLHKKKIAAALITAIVILSGVFIVNTYKDHQLYYGEYYVTMHGTKYHLKHCVTIQGRETRRLTNEDIGERKYEPCSVCMPGK